MSCDKYNTERPRVKLIRNALLDCSISKEELAKRIFPEDKDKDEKTEELISFFLDSFDISRKRLSMKRNSLNQEVNYNLGDNLDE